MTKKVIEQEALQSAQKMGQFPDDLASFFGMLVDMAESDSPDGRSFCDVAPLLRVGEAAAHWYSQQCIDRMDGIRHNLADLAESL